MFCFCHGSCDCVCVACKCEYVTHSTVVSCSCELVFLGFRVWHIRICRGNRLHHAFGDNCKCFRIRSRLKLGRCNFSQHIRATALICVEYFWFHHICWWRLCVLHFRMPFGRLHIASAATIQPFTVQLYLLLFAFFSLHSNFNLNRYVSCWLLVFCVCIYYRFVFVLNCNFYANANIVCIGGRCMCVSFPTIPLTPPPHPLFALPPHFSLCIRCSAQNFFVGLCRNSLHLKVTCGGSLCTLIT